MKSFVFIVLASMASLDPYGTEACEDRFGKYTEKEKIELLIKSIEDLEGVQFDRNGSLYDSGKAATYLRMKWNRAGSSVKTARDFIDKVASVSSRTGRPHYIVYSNGKRVKLRDYLIEKLAEIERRG